jgi:hypothetical protein
VSDLREGAGIVLLAVGAACFYGVLHDLVTTHICLEYFTIAHPPIFGGTHDPLLLALGWGVIATWWVGLPLGVLLAAAARLGRWPKRTARHLVRPVAILLGVMAFSALAAGIMGYVSVREMGEGGLEARLNADLWAHSASYVSGFCGGLCLAGLTVWRRGKLSEL